jgi:hypothetical protein
VNKRWSKKQILAVNGWWVCLLMPFVPILKDGDDEVLVRRAVQLLQQDPQLNELESLLAFFASFVLETEAVAQILR